RDRRAHHPPRRTLALRGAAPLRGARVRVPARHDAREVAGGGRRLALGGDAEPRQPLAAPERGDEPGRRRRRPGSGDGLALPGAPPRLARVPPRRVLPALVVGPAHGGGGRPPLDRPLTRDVSALPSRRGP